MITALSQKRTLFYSVLPDSLRMISWHRYCLKRRRKPTQVYAPRKNVTHEPTGGRVQSTFGQYSILSTTIPDGDTGDCHIIQDSRFQLSRTLRFRGTHCAAIGGRRFAESVCVRVCGWKYFSHGHR